MTATARIYPGVWECRADQSASPVASSLTLKDAIEKGLKEDASALTRELVKEREPLEIIDSELIPALDQVGKGFEQALSFSPSFL